MVVHKPKTIDEIMAKFTIKRLPLIKGEPDYEGIYEIMQLFYANAVTLPTPQVGGNHGHIISNMNPKLYTTLTTTAGTIPPDPGL